MKKLILSFLVSIITIMVWAQEPMKQKLDMRIDSIGNALIKVSMTMNANQWQMWVQSVGNNPALLKRSMERTLPAYFLDDFNLEKNDMDRSFEFTFKAYGVCQVDKKGRWIVTTDQKDPDITELTDHKYMMVFTDAVNNLQQTQIIEFPSAASDISIENDAFGKTQFEFDMDAPGGGVNFMFWGGIALCVIGGGWLIKSMMS